MFKKLDVGTVSRLRSVSQTSALYPKARVVDIDPGRCVHAGTHPKLTDKDRAFRCLGAFGAESVVHEADQPIDAAGRLLRHPYRKVRG